jgi:putative ATP-dependent endonuclease of OLD family
MKVRRLQIENFRGVESGAVEFDGNTLLVGGNNVGKSTVCEALDLVLGPERLYRRPVIDEHDFHMGRYLDADRAAVVVRIEALLLDLSEEAIRRFGQHLRLWNEDTDSFVDAAPDGADHTEDPAVSWALPLVFLGRYDADEDDFIGETYFDHPQPDLEDLDEEAQQSLGHGRTVFSRASKRLCGFVFLRALRTGNRALSLQRGSLLDTVLKLADEGATEMWLDTLDTLRGLDPAIGEVEQLRVIRTQIRSRLAQFVGLAPGDDSTAFFASDLTRDHLREVVKLFIATQPSAHLVPYGRQGTGSINLIVFALLTMIADLKGKQSVIFAMEEPEIALPPHTQRRVTRFVLGQMGQSIVTSHSPYVIEQFEPGNVVMLQRDGAGGLIGSPIDTAGVKPKSYRTQRRQFAEAILARGVLVVEGSTETVVVPAVSTALERFRNVAAADGDEATPEPSYVHLDLAGVTIFTSDGDGDVPRWGPMFKALGKSCFGMIDQPSAALNATALANIATFDLWRESTHKGIEALLTTEIAPPVLRRFLVTVGSRSDYPSVAAYAGTLSDDEVRKLAFDVLKARKGEGYGYAGLLVEECQTEGELPVTIVELLDAVNATLSPTPEPDTAPGDEGESGPDPATSAAEPEAG